METFTVKENHKAKRQTEERNKETEKIICNPHNRLK